MTLSVGLRNGLGTKKEEEADMRT